MSLTTCAGLKPNGPNAVVKKRAYLFFWHSRPTKRPRTRATQPGPYSIGVLATQIRATGNNPFSKCGI